MDARQSIHRHLTPAHPIHPSIIIATFIYGVCQVTKLEVDSKVDAPALGRRRVCYKLLACVVPGIRDNRPLHDTDLIMIPPY